MGTNGSSKSNEGSTSKFSTLRFCLFSQILIVIFLVCYLVVYDDREWFVLKRGWQFEVYGVASRHVPADIHIVPATERCHEILNKNKTSKYVINRPSTPQNKSLTDRITSAKYSSYELVTNEKGVIKGSLLHFVINARDTTQQMMSTGNDYWFATMSTNTPTNASTAGRVIDYNNGTYSVYFYAAWSGHAEINITLVHPSKAIQFLHDTYWNVGPDVFWSASFDYKNETVNTASNTICCIEPRDANSSFSCAYPSLGALGDYVFVCKPPGDGKCRPLNMISINVKETDKMTSEAAGTNAELFQSQYFNQRLNSGPRNISIADNNKQEKTSNVEDCILEQPSSPSHGYWYNGSWTTFLYKSNNWTNASDMRECLRDKKLILLGDSTTRQWAYNIPKLLDLKNELLRREFTDIFFESEYKQLNLTVNFRFHPEVITSQKVPFHLHRYFVSILDSIATSQCSDIIIVLSPWAHFPQWTRDSFTQRLLKLREAVDRLKMRCPNVPIIIKGPHLREHIKSMSRWGWSDYLNHQIGFLLEEIFHRSIAWYLDVWDMNLSYQSRKFIHMPDIVVQEELKLFVSHICSQNKHVSDV